MRHFLKNMSVPVWCLRGCQIIATIDLVLILCSPISNWWSSSELSLPKYTVVVSNYDHPPISTVGFGRVEDCTQIAITTTDVVRRYDPTFTMECHGAPTHE